MYVAVKGGERAIDNAHKLLASERRGEADVPEIGLEQIKGSSSWPWTGSWPRAACMILGDLAALALKQAWGDPGGSAARLPHHPAQAGRERTPGSHGHGS